MPSGHAAGGKPITTRRNSRNHLRHPSFRLPAVLVAAAAPAVGFAAGETFLNGQSIYGQPAAVSNAARRRRGRPRVRTSPTAKLSPSAATPDSSSHGPSTAWTGVASNSQRLRRRGFGREVAVAYVGAIRPTVADPIRPRTGAGRTAGAGLDPVVTSGSEMRLSRLGPSARVMSDTPSPCFAAPPLLDTQSSRHRAARRERAAHAADARPDRRGLRLRPQRDRIRLQRGGRSAGIPRAGRWPRAVQHQGHAADGIAAQTSACPAVSTVSPSTRRSKRCAITGIACAWRRGASSIAGWRSGSRAAGSAPLKGFHPDADYLRSLQRRFPAPADALRL